MSLVEEYINKYVYYCKKYDGNVMLFMECGMFYEAYSYYDFQLETVHDINKGPDLYKISDLLNIIFTRKNKSITEISIKNPYMLGFPTVSKNKFIKILVNNGYTCILMDQISEAGKISRKVSGIYSIGTFIENISDFSNYTTCIYIEEINRNLCIGIASIDISTGKCLIHECLSKDKDSDNKAVLQSCLTLLTSISPKELLVFNKSKLSKEYIFNYFDISQIYIHYKEDIDKKYTQINYQNEILNIAFRSHKTLISQIENLELTRHIFSLIGLVALLDFLIDHNNKLLDLNKPEIYIDTKYLFLGNNATYQLNIINNDSSIRGVTTKYKSLLDVLNQTSTAIGKRYLYDRLLMPFTEKNDIEEIYNKAEQLLSNNKWKIVDSLLMSIKDIERLYRRIKLKIIHPYEMHDFIKSCENIGTLIKYFNENNLEQFLPKNKFIKKLNKLNRQFDYLFVMDRLKLYPLSDIKESIFNKGIYEEIDNINKNIDNGHDFLDKVCNVLEEIIGSKIKTGKNDKDGHFIILTKIKGNILKEKLEKKTVLEIGEHQINIDQIIFDTSTKITKLYFPFLKERSSEINKSTDELSYLVRSKYLECCEYIHNKYSKLIIYLCNFIAKIDYYKTIAKTANIYNYTRPIINKKDYGYIKCKNMRHPIVERIIDYEYVPHDIQIGEELKGMLLYGINSSGKSVMMKALGMCIIMAQAGFYVPATEFIYSPYNSIYTRICGNDNIFKGMSSFVVEMCELSAIQKRSDNYTLVLGDEVCRGTENISANALVATTLIKLSEVRASFIFATHLHEIMDLEIIKKIDNIKAFHLTVEQDPNTGNLLYDRKLCEGSGERLYGIVVAKYIIDNKEFMEMANSIKNTLLNNTSLIEQKSHYNRELYVYMCQNCGVRATKDIPLDTHHINFQKDCIDGYVNGKNHIAKNSKYNLIILCKKCHNNVHNNKLTINKYIMSSAGRKYV